MTPLPPPLGTGEIRLWRLDRAIHAPGWATGEGSFRVGGRWNSPGVRAVYASLDPATAVLEVAVHKGFRVLDTEPHMLTSARIDPTAVHVVLPQDVPNPNWLSPVTPNRNQQTFGDALLAAHRLILIPSAVSRHSWNVIFTAGAVTADMMTDITQERFALDPRLQS
ncbi:hypothetical protein CG51_06925 [Haematobacter missouriensis]|uniref:RES domain-containing protein n=1 Tax=Haematobacter missouriensis TaxID=366616 RepID=A0A212ASD0_9RHOB|nr:RES domain-containing protein [Haematobacter missouriensis]KFI29846.1 hypothetical protein CG51_06925 [Haematobacter missouriensis]OWJ74776.1 hypothetical protein CDV53_12525 [Haematobacter missouriensis]OWJ84383.1 hypothetical protein CDV52_08460 [Haematobacter missouriensis]